MTAHAFSFSRRYGTLGEVDLELPLAYNMTLIRLWFHGHNRSLPAHDQLYRQDHKGRMFLVRSDGSRVSRIFLQMRLSAAITFKRSTLMFSKPPSIIANLLMEDPPSEIPLLGGRP